MPSWCLRFRNIVILHILVKFSLTQFRYQYSEYGNNFKIQQKFKVHKFPKQAGAVKSLVTIVHLHMIQPLHLCKTPYQKL